MLSRRIVRKLIKQTMNNAIWKSDVPMVGYFYLFYNPSLGKFICSINISDFLPFIDDEIKPDTSFDIQNNTVYILNGLRNRKSFYSIAELFDILKIPRKN